MLLAIVDGLNIAKQLGRRGGELLTHVCLLMSHLGLIGQFHILKDKNAPLVPKQKEPKQDTLEQTSMAVKITVEEVSAWWDRVGDWFKNLPSLGAS